MEKFTQKKNGQWMWSREYRDEMKKRLIWDDFPPETITKDDWIWSWSHTLTVSPKGIGQYDGASSDFVHRVFAVPVGEYLYLDKWWAMLYSQMMKSSLSGTISCSHQNCSLNRNVLT